MTKWEYDIIISAELTGQDIRKVLNEKGEQGWFITGTVSMDGGKFMVFLSREKHENDK